MWQFPQGASPAPRSGRSLAPLRILLRYATAVVLRPDGKRIASLLLVLLAARAASAAAAAAPELPPLDATTSLLVVAPHPDDETLCCAGVMQRVARAGGRVSVVWVTSGDASLLDLLLVERAVFGSAAKLRELGARRMREARAAAALLGVPAGGQLFLGYPDRGVTALLGPYHDSAFTSHYTGAAQVPYAEALFPGHPYSGVSLERDFAAVLARVRPTLVLAPSPDDSHPDHAAAGRLALAMMAQRGALAQLRGWIVHGGEGWPSPRELSPGLPLTRAPLLAGAPLASFGLTLAEEDGKLAAVRAYRTQLTILSPFLLSFVRTTELYTAAP